MTSRSQPARRRSSSSRPRSGGGRRPSSASRPVQQGGEFAMPESLTPALPAVTTFAELDMPRELLATLTAQGVTEPFPIQGATLPNTLAGRDALGRGRTGSGKTLAFGLAVLARLAGRRAEPTRPLALVLVPTRELATQVTTALQPYADSVKLRTATVVGGLSIGRQSQALRRGAEVVVATPGRLADLIDRRDCDLSQVEITVLDEADQMADMGFLPQVTRLLEQVRPGGQRMLFSATLDRNVDRLVRRFLADPVTHSVDPSAGAVTTMEHHLLHVSDTDKFAVTAEIGAREGRTIMFVGMKHAADRLARKLLREGVRAAALHGGKSQPQRDRTLAQFKDGQVTVLVATNVAARGIHVDGLDLVLNVDPPTDPKDYLHRGGRTARAGESGTVVTLVLPEQRRETDRMVSDAGISPSVATVRPGDAELAAVTGAQTPSGEPVVIPVPVKAAAAAPAERSQSRRGGSSGRRRRGGGGGNGGAAHGSPRGAATGAPAGRGEGGAHRAEAGRSGQARRSTRNRPAASSYNS
ncbi:DEAD/DEAH box helicase [Spirillospora sp. NPDC050679]